MLYGELWSFPKVYFKLWPFALSIWNIPIGYSNVSNELKVFFIRSWKKWIDFFCTYYWFYRTLCVWSFDIPSQNYWTNLAGMVIIIFRYFLEKLANFRKLNQIGTVLNSPWYSRSLLTYSLNFVDFNEKYYLFIENQKK